MLATVAVALSMFSAPASNFQNEYLRESRGFSATRISLYSAIVNTPVGIGVAIAGPQADRRGRRLVGIIGIIGGIGFAVVRYGFGGPLMWIAGSLATVIGAATIPALGVYGPELFPTSRRGLANGLLTCVAVVGSVVGLIFVGQVTEHLGWSFGKAFAVLAVVPLLAIFVVARYPETAQRALEDLNPEDRPGPNQLGPAQTDTDPAGQTPRS
jgi:MFS family permease